MSTAFGSCTAFRQLIDLQQRYICDDIPLMGLLWLLASSWSTLIIVLVIVILVLIALLLAFIIPSILLVRIIRVSIVVPAASESVCIEQLILVDTYDSS